jgi:hypothetical protein
VVATGGGVRLSNDIFSVFFAAQHCYAPTDLRAGNGEAGNLLSEYDEYERWAGISYYPHTASWMGSNCAMTLQPTTGPAAVVVLQTTWSASDADGGMMMTGTSGITVHADGRIHRNETVTVAQGRTGSYLLAYVAVAGDRAAGGSAWTPAGDFPLDAGDFTGDEGTPGVLCAVHEVEGHAIGWAQGQCSTEECALRMDPKGQFLLLASDWLHGSTVPSATYTGNFMLAVDPHDNCSHVQALGEALATPPTLTTQEGTVTYDPSGGYFEAALSPQNRLRVDGPGSDVAAATFRFSGSATSTRPSKVKSGNRELRDGEDYLWQVTDQSGWLLLTEGLHQGASLEVEF